MKPQTIHEHIKRTGETHHEPKGNRVPDSPGQSRTVPDSPGQSGTVRDTKIGMSPGQSGTIGVSKIVRDFASVISFLKFGRVSFLLFSLFFRSRRVYNPRVDVFIGSGNKTPYLGRRCLTQSNFSASDRLLGGTPSPFSCLGLSRLCPGLSRLCPGTVPSLSGTVSPRPPAAPPFRPTYVIRSRRTAFTFAVVGATAARAAAIGTAVTNFLKLISFRFACVEVDNVSSIWDCIFVFKFA